ncbi:dipeptidase [Cohnella massiliensis]|uniref:dipeptidase n=1 Tax=Cohnella massiliensis TaxID=1816691 RepID=UPI0009BB694F|nr:dipeptidase [Cohnella massiliensis]
MKAADLHCDVLFKMLKHPELSFREPSGGKLDVTADRLREGEVSLQAFAIYLPEDGPKDPETVLREAELFWSKVLSEKGIRLIRTAGDLQAAWDGGQTGALLSLEGADGLREQWWCLRLLHLLGLRLLGPTWNWANWACDGAMEPRGGGLTRAGKRLVNECESMGILIDVSHMSERGFWDVAELSSRPFFASHSNVRAVREHSRNLTDAQLAAIFRADGIVGLTFVPWFLSDREPASVDDVLRHVEHVCSLGGERHLAFGSDFDGIERHVHGLSQPGHYPSLADALLKRYPEPIVRGMLGENAVRFLRKYLPQ